MGYILSEGKGIMMWLKNRGNNEQFAGYLLKLFNQQTNITFHRITFTSCNNKRFQRFTTWYGLQNISQLVKDFQVYRVEKLKQKEISLENYYNSDWHKFFMSNQIQTTNELYKKFKNKIRYGEFKAFHKKSKCKFGIVS